MIWNSLHNVTHPFGSAIPDAPYSDPQQGIAFIAAMAPKRATRSRPNPTLPQRDARSRSRSPRTRASQPYVESPYRKALAAWHRFNDYVLRKFYEDLHKWWTEWSVTNAVPYFQRMPRIGSLIDRNLFRNALGVNYPNHPVNEAYLAELVGEEDAEMEEL